VKNFIYLLIISVFSTVVVAEELKLDQTNLFVTTPKSIVYQTSVTSSHPLLTYKLPKGEDGGTPGWPDFKVTRWNKTISTFLKENNNNQFSDFRLLKDDIEINGVKAFETSSTGIAVFDFVGGISSESNINTHSFVLDFHSYIIICSMTTGEKEHEMYIPTLRDLCFSMRSKAG
jgi:hypothetical protein